MPFGYALAKASLLSNGWWLARIRGCDFGSAAWKVFGSDPIISMRYWASAIANVRLVVIKP